MNTLKHVSLIGLLVCANTALLSQVISDISFEGISRTDETYLRGIITCEVGDIYNEIVVEEDLQRLKNLGSIGNAHYTTDVKDQSVQITFEVQEIRTLLPVLNAGGIRNNLWLQLGFADINWSGKGQQLSAVYQNSDSRHSGNIFFKNARVKNSNWGYSASLSSWKSREPLFFDQGTVIYDYDNDGITLTGIRHLDFNQSIEFGGTYFVERYNKVDNPGEVLAPESLIQPKWLGKFVYTNDRLNYDFFYLKGFRLINNFQSVYNTYDDTWFVSLQITASNYIRTSRKGNLAQRLKLGIATNNDSPFAPFVADSHVNIRGIGNRIDRGTAQIILNNEYRHTLHHKTNWAVQAVGFADLGTWRNPGGTLSDLFDSDQFRWFIGGGFRLIYNKLYGASLRIDYGVDIFDKSQRGFVLGLGQYF